MLKDFGNKTREELSRDDLISLDEVKKLLRKSMTGHNTQPSARIRENVTQEPDTDLVSIHLKRGSRHEPSRRSRNDFSRRLSSHDSDGDSEDSHLMDPFTRDIENISCSNSRSRSSSPGGLHSAIEASETYSSPRVEISSRNSPGTVIEDLEELEDSEELYLNPALESIKRINPDAGYSEYSGTIMEVRSSAVTQHIQPSKPTLQTVPRPPTSALLSENEAVGDDWLIDDVKPSRQKHTNIDSVFTTRGTRSRKSHDSVDEGPAFKR